MTALLRFKHLTALFLLAACITGCSTRGYSGPARPESEIATISVHKVGEITIESVVVDGYPISSFADNVEVLPGTNNFKLYYQFEDAQNCAPRDLFCLTTIVKGVCEGSIYSNPGRTYLLTIENKFSTVGVRVSAKGYFDLLERSDEPNPGAGSCKQDSNY